MRMPSLEVLRYAPRGVPHATPILFVHGAYVGAWCWDEHFLPYFAEHGYAVYAPSLRGHGESAGRESLDSAGIDDYVADILAVAHSLDTPPILIGHSMGAILVQRALRRSRAPCAVLMTPVPPSGLVVPGLALTQRDPELLRDVALLEQVHLPPDRFKSLRRALFSNKLSDALALRHLKRMQPESERALFDLSWPQYLFFEPAAIPVLVVGAEKDALFAPWMVEQSAAIYGVSAEIFSGMAHAMMLEPDWEDAAGWILAWLEESGF